jgi:hypothetical protein
MNTTPHLSFAFIRDHSAKDGKRMFHEFNTAWPRVKTVTVDDIFRACNEAARGLMRKKTILEPADVVDLGEPWTEKIGVVVYEPRGLDAVTSADARIVVNSNVPPDAWLKVQTMLAAAVWILLRLDHHPSGAEAREYQNICESAAESALKTARERLKGEE